MKRGLNIYPKNIFRLYINTDKQNPVIFYAYSDLTSIELTDYLADNIYIILSNESTLKNTIIPTSRIVYIEEIDSKNAQGERIYFYEGTHDLKSSYESTIAFRLITSF